MSIDKIDIIDIISSSEGNVVLTISDHLSWDETSHFQFLQDKIKDYFRFIESGQIQVDYPAVAGKAIIIETILKYKLSDDARLFLDKAKDVIAKAGIRFQWKLLD